MDRLEAWKRASPVPRLVCIGGGIGLSPLVPILSSHMRLVAAWPDPAQPATNGQPGTASSTLLASARGLEEAVFLHRIAKLHREAIAAPSFHSPGGGVLDASPSAVSICVADTSVNPIPPFASQTSEQGQLDSKHRMESPSRILLDVGFETIPEGELAGVSYLPGRFGRDHLRRAVWGRVDGPAPRLEDPADAIDAKCTG